MLHIQFSHFMYFILLYVIRRIWKLPIMQTTAWTASVSGRKASIWRMMIIQSIMMWLSSLLGTRGLIVTKIALLYIYIIHVLTIFYDTEKTFVPPSISLVRHWDCLMWLECANLTAAAASMKTQAWPWHLQSLMSLATSKSYNVDYILYTIINTS